MLIHSLTRLKDPTSIPIEVKEIKTYLKIDHDLEDKLIEDMIKAAVNTFEDVTATALMPQSWRVLYKNLDSSIIELPIRPVMEISNISTVTANGIKDITNYEIINDSLVLRSLYDADFISIDFTAGINSKNFIPANIKFALMEHIAFLYENRGEQRSFDRNKYAEFRAIKY